MSADRNRPLRMSQRRLIGVLAVCVGLVGALLVAPAAAQGSAAPLVEVAEAAVKQSPGSPVKMADLSKFQPGNIISDALFFDSGTMSEAQIQQFLESKVPTCQSGFVCLKDWYDTSRATSADPMCGVYSGGMRERASAIIYKVARACGINPQVILVMLQKEQGLVMHTSPGATRYKIAMGQGCPDTAACDSRYFGFFNQVFGAAWQLKRYANPPGTSQYFTWYSPGKTWNVRWHENTACGSSPVYIQNQATANLYYYTPYQPNAAALAAGYGIASDPCSAYGNRNFYNYFTDWFGSTVASNPFGRVELIEARPGEFRVVGWVADPDTASPISIHVYANDKGAAFTADLERSDVGAAYPALGSRHGFNVTIPAAGPAVNNVCIYAINSGPGANVLMGCQAITALSGSPVGKLDTPKGVNGGVEVSGWAIDPDTASPTSVHIYIDGVGTAIAADRSRPELASTYPVYGTNHGFSATLAAAPGPRSVCAYAINWGPGGTTPLGCQSVTVPGIADLGRHPVGAFESLTVAGTTATVQGWALDPDTSSPIKVHIYVGASSAAYNADKPRPDLVVSYPSHGANHGFAESVTLPAGTSQVCAYAINSGAGGHSFLGCKTATVPSAQTDLGRAPIGSFESLTLNGATATAGGWAIDPDTASPIKIHLYVASAGREYLADKARADVGAAYPTYGANHGFSEPLTLPIGTTSVCAYAINSGAGGHSFLGCRSVTVTAPIVDQGRPPFGNFEAVQPGAGGATVTGWAIDPDTSNSIAVHIYVDATSAAYSANKPRPDVAAIYKGLGDAHGFTEFIAMSPGAHRLCVYPINNGAGGNAWLGCRDVIVP